VHAYGHDVADRWLLRDEVIESGNEFGYRSIRPGSIRPTSAPNAVAPPNFWDDPPLVLGRSAFIKLHQIITEVGNNDDTPWAIAVG